MSYLLIKALIRYAKKQSDPVEWLEGIIGGNFQVTLAEQGKVMTSAAMNGSQFSYTIPAGLDPASIIALAMLALEYLEKGITPSRRVMPHFR